MAGLVSRDAILLFEDDDLAPRPAFLEAVRGREPDDAAADHEKRHGAIVWTFLLLVERSTDITATTRPAPSASR